MKDCCEVEELEFDGGRPASLDAGDEGKLVYVPPGHSVYVFVTKDADG